MTKTFTVSLSDRAFDQVQKIADELAISKESVFRNGLLFMRLYANTRYNEKIRLVYEKDGVQQEITLEDP